MARYLKYRNLNNAYEALQIDLEKQANLLPQRVSWDGSLQNQSLADLNAKYNIPGDAIVRLHASSTLDSSLKISSILAKFCAYEHQSASCNIASNLSLMHLSNSKIIQGSSLIGNRYEKLISVHGIDLVNLRTHMLCFLFNV